MSATDPEDAKIVTLARAARARTAAAEGACVRDRDGRTYAASSVDLPHLRLSAIAVAVAMAVSSGAGGLEAVAVSRDEPVPPDDRAVIQDLPGTDIKIIHLDRAGSVVSTDVVQGTT